MHNPLRSEADMFRALVIIAFGCGAVIALALIWTPAAGAVLLAAEIGVAAGFLWRSSRGRLPRTAEIAEPAEDDSYRVLVVANQTVGGRALLEEIRNRCKERGAEILVVVPALTRSRLEYLASDVDQAIREARQRLDESCRTMAAAGIKARGEVGDHHDPNAAMEDALRVFPADEVIISTHPPHKSRWLESGVVERARSEVPVPVTHVVVDLEAERAAGETTATAPSPP